MIYDYTLLAKRSGFDLTKHQQRSKCNQLIELVIRDVCEQLTQEQRLEIFKRYNIYDRDNPNLVV